MKVIYPDKVTGVTAANALANYPDDNLLDGHPKKIWNSGVSVSSVTVSVSEGANAVGFAGVSAVSIALTVKNSNSSTTLLSKVSYDLKGINNYYKFFTDSYTSYTSFWIDYDYQSVDHNLVFDFENVSGSTAQAGIVKAGPARGFYEPGFDLSESMMDYSIVKELNNGAFYIRKRDVVKTYSGTVELERDGDFYVFMRDVILKEGPNPLFWRITDYNNNDWAVFARVSSMPKGDHNQRRHSTINFSFIEVI
uniref:Uncharacterized protein n=1 Tax=viral metagenome TaxID=1070528 RepID=A0A6M3INR4_9ZZZZ